MKHSKFIAAVLAAIMLASACLSVSAAGGSLLITSQPSSTTGSSGSGLTLVRDAYGALYFYNGTTYIPVNSNSFSIPGYSGSTFSYDPNTGYWYDPSTGYYYDPTTGSYFNNYYSYDPNSWYWYQYYQNYQNYYNPQSGGSLTMDQYSSLFFGNGNIPYSSNPSIISVQGNSIVAVAPGQATVTVYINGQSTYYVTYTVTVNAVTTDPSNYYIYLSASPNPIAVGANSNIYCQVYYNNQPVTMAVDLSLDPNAAGILSLDADNKVVTGVGVGTGTVIATIPNTNITQTITIQVANGNVINNLIINPNYNTGYVTWTVSTPGTYNYYSYNYPYYLINNGTTVNPYYYYNYGYNYNYYNQYYPYGSTYDPQASYYAYLKAQGIDTDKYTIEYKTMYINGEWQSFMVLVPKEDSQTTGTTTTTTTKQPTEEEKRKAAEEAARKALEAAEKKAKAEKEAAEKATAELVAKAKAGKIGWDEVYKDVNKDSYYYSAVRYFLNTEVMSGHETGYFGTTELIRKGEIEEILAAYYEFITGKKYDVKTGTDADVVLVREDIAKMIYDFAKKLGIDTSARKDLTKYDDGKKISKDAYDAYSWVIAEGIFNKTESSLLLDTPIDRARFAVILYNLDGLIGD